MAKAKALVFEEREPCGKQMNTMKKKKGSLK